MRSQLNRRVLKWAALRGGLAVVLAALPCPADSVVVFNEISYHPRDDAAGLEWVELHNQMGIDIDLSMWSLSGAVAYTFPPGTRIGAGDFLVVAASPPEVRALAPDPAQVLGPFSGRLANGGATLRLINNSGRLMNEVRYGDDGDWPVAPDGSGVTLAKVNPLRESDAPSNWTWSDQVHGTPGRANFEAGGPRARGLRFNEWTGVQAEPARIELIHTGTEPVDLTGTRIEVLGRVPGTSGLGPMVLQPGACVVLTDYALGLLFGETDRLFLWSAEDRVLDAVRTDRILRGRYPDGTGPWLFPAWPTLGSANRFEVCPDIVINEILYHSLETPAPSGGGTVTLVPEQVESRTWIELVNKGGHEVDLSGWRLTKGVDFEFPDGTVLGPDAYVVVAKDAATLQSIHPDVRILGDLGGHLSNKGEEVLLVDRAGNPVDRVHYHDGGAWPAYADGGGCSLELRDPRVDNGRPEAWAASDESGRAHWQSFSYRGVAAPSPVGDDSLYSEFVMGLLDAGEVLIDDLHVVEDPDGAATELLQDGDFTAGLAKWRILGNHRRSRVDLDPADGANPVLHLTASGPTEHMHNHAETTLAARRWISNGRTYEVRFRARWVAGSPLLHTRLFFNRLARTTVLPVPDHPGTPGRRNSRAQANIGPTFGDLRHSPPVPDAHQPVTVTVRAGDPDGVKTVTLHFREDDEAWQAETMDLVAGIYTAAIPGQGQGTLVQFYVQARDGLGEVSWYPAAGPESFAQYRVQDHKARTTGVHNYRIVMRNEQRDLLYEPTHLMSNERQGATLIVNEDEVYYSAGVRLKSSEHGRPKDTRVGFDIALDPAVPFRGVHGDLAFDRSNGQQVGQQEMLLHTAMNRFGGPSKYHDLGYVIAPKDAHTSGAEVQMARFDRIYTREAFGEAGGSGTLFEYELVYPLTQTVGNDPEGLKIPQEGGGYRGLSVTTYLGPDKEDYRWHFLIKNRRDLDLYDPIIRMTSVLGLSGQALDEGIAQTLDVGQWIASFAVGATHGVQDNWISGASHNALFYHRPTDDKVLFFLHDMDYTQGGMSLKTNAVLRAITADPHWNRVFYSTVYGFLQTSYNRGYLSYWAAQYAALLPEQGWSSWLSYMDTRGRNVMNQVTAAVPAYVPFDVTSAARGLSPDGLARVQGRAWLDVHEIRTAATGAALDLTWVDLVTWQADVPVDTGQSAITLEAYDWLDGRAGSETIPVQP